MKDPQDVVTSLFVATDARNWDGVAEAFHTKVVLDYASMTGNPAAELAPEDIINSWKGILPGFEHTHHQLGNFLSDVNGNQATVSCYGTATHYLADENGSIWIVVGTYDFELVKEDNWKISKMKFNYRYQDGNANLVEKAMNNLK